MTSLSSLDALTVNVVHCDLLSTEYKTFRYWKVKATQTECEHVKCTACDPGSHQWLPESRCELGRVVPSSDGAESPTFPSRAVLMGM